MARLRTIPPRPGLWSGGVTQLMIEETKRDWLPEINSSGFSQKQSKSVIESFWWAGKLIRLFFSCRFIRKGPVV